MAMEKLLTTEHLAEVCAELKTSGKTIVLCHGVWDWLHPGHHRHLKAARRQGDVLVVTVTPDRYVNKGPGRPLYDENLRAESLCDLGYVDLVAINQWPTAVEAIRLLKPDVFAKGSEYAKAEDDTTGSIITEEAAVKEVGGRMHFTNEIVFSSTENINRYLSPYPAAARDFLDKFRHEYAAADIIKTLQELKKLKVLIVGETIIDEYCYCQGLGKTPKDNIIAVKYLNEERFAGGVLAAANHIAGFCQSVDLVTCLGNGYDYAQFVLEHLKANIRAKFFHNPDGPTIAKRRFVDPSFMAKMFEVAYLEDQLPAALSQQITDYIAQALTSGNYDLVIVIDYGHGLISDSAACVLSQWTGKFLAVNTQANSANNGFNVITKYPRADYVSLDEPELRLACRDRSSDMQTLVEEIAKQLDCTAIAITRGHKGALTYGEGEFYEIPALIDHSLDRMGAGDAFLAITAPCAASGFDMQLVGFIGNAAAAMKIQTVGNREAIEPVSLFKFIKTLLK